MFRSVHIRVDGVDESIELGNDRPLEKFNNNHGFLLSNARCER